MTESTTTVSGPLVSSLFPILSNLSENTHMVGTAWMVMSVFFTTYSTTHFLQYEGGNLVENRQWKNAFDCNLSRPALLTFYRFGGSLLLGVLLHPNLDIFERIMDTKKAVPAFALPALFLFIANFSNSISLQRIGISLTYTSKCAIPLMTVLLTLLLDGPKAMPHGLALASLMPIALGIGAASWNSPTFETIGFLAALASATAQSALNVSSKRVMSRTGLAGAQAQRAMVAVGFGITCFVSLLQLNSAKKTKSSRGTKSADPPVWLVAMAASAYHFEYVLSFMFVKLVSPITYGACDAIRRLSIIIAGRAMFGGSPFSRINILGIAFALLGALCYSITSNI